MCVSIHPHFKDAAAQARMQFFSKNDPNDKSVGGSAVEPRQEAPKPEVARKPYQFVHVSVNQDGGVWKA